MKYSNLSHIGMIIHTTTLDTMEKIIAIYGGTTWEKIEDMFLLGASSDYEINSTGGEINHTLTINEMPNHKHEPTLYGSTPGGGEVAGVAVSGGTGTVNAWHTTTFVGGSQAHNNMPPYKAVYIWERTA